MQPIQTKSLSEEYKKYLHEDFLANEEHYWRVREKLLNQYRGWWIAIHRGQVVASSKDVWEITEAVGKLGCHAYIAKVGEEDVVFKVRRAVDPLLPKSTVNHLVTLPSPTRKNGAQAKGWAK